MKLLLNLLLSASTTSAYLSTSPTFLVHRRHTINQPSRQTSLYYKEPGSSGGNDGTDNSSANVWSVLANTERWISDTLDKSNKAANARRDAAKLEEEQKQQKQMEDELEEKINMHFADPKQQQPDEKKKKTKRIIRRIRKCELCGVIVEFTTRKDSKIFLSLDDGTGVIECVIWAPSTITSSEDNNTSFGFVDEEEENYYTLNQVERDPFGRMVADDGVLLLHGKLRLGETVFVQGRVSLYNGKKQIVVNSMQMICEREGLARERDLETLFWLDVVEQRMDKGY